MESLAWIVAILFFTALISGPIAIGLTFLVPKTLRGRKVRRLLVSLFSIWGILNGIQFALAAVPTFPRLVGLMSVVTAGFAIKREFGIHRKLDEH
jgi:hypothetical protein